MGEYVAHGRDAAAAPVAQRALDWYLALPSADQARRSNDVATSLLLVGRARDARALLDSALQPTSTSPARLGLLGVARIMSGDTTGARDVDLQLAAFDGSQAGSATLWRGRMAGARGDCTAAVGLLRSALQSGIAHDDIAHHWWASAGNARSCAGIARVVASRD